MATSVGQSRASFNPAAFETFRFLAREIDERGRVTLRYALDHAIEFVEEFELPVEAELSLAARDRVDGLLSLLHWVAGVSYFKTAVPHAVDCGSLAPPPAAAALLEAIYSEGLGEFAYKNKLRALPRPTFPIGPLTEPPRTVESQRYPRVLVPIGGGKDSAVALEVVRRSGRELALFSVGNAPPIARTAAVAGLPHLICTRRLDPGLVALNKAGALNGHIPITAIVSCVALLTAALRGFDAVAMANERSASNGNLAWDGIDVNHQFSKGLRAEGLLRSAVAEAASGLEIFSVLRPASELAIARRFAQLEQYHQAFTSCNAIFRLDPALRGTSWCCDCPKCRFVFLALAPFCEPAHLRDVFGHDLLDDEHQFAGFARLTATGGHKPFECVGEEEESLAAIRMLATQPRWREHRVVRRLLAEVLPRYDLTKGDPAQVLALSDQHFVPDYLLRDVTALLGA
jgi:hypothetical protein